MTNGINSTNKYNKSI